MTFTRFVGLGLALVGGLAFGITLCGCNQQTVDAKLRSLEASGDATYICQGIDPTRGPELSDQEDRGFELSSCPESSATPTRKLVALVTQTATNELAIVDLTYQRVVDVDPAVPGFTFLHLPSRPGAIASTPGGDASFVGLISPGKTGISAVPTTCLGAPRGAEPGRDAQHERDVTTFPACTLPSAPGEMVVLVEPPAADGTIAASCSDPSVPEDKDPPASHKLFNGSGRDCIANLTTEHGPPGRRKLLVTLPDQGQLAVIDAQELLDRAPGSFDPCKYDAFTLNGSPDLGGQTQVVPADLQPGLCKTVELPVPPPPPSTRPRPSGVSLAADGRLFVGDLAVPAVHVVDTSSVCKLKELAPLLPMSFTSPSRVVTTSRVVVSPVTPNSKQYLYAIDAGDQPTTSVMAFDVSADSVDRTPIVRSGSVRQPREVPDRISFAAPVQDIEFAYRDLPREDPDTGVAEVGVQCDPDPASSRVPPTPGVQDRTTSDYTEGARPGFLRGLFGLVMLTSGQIVVIDVDDFDAPCRRPRTTNPDSAPDYRGCHDDGALPKYLTYSADGSSGVDVNQTPSVSDEVSCNMVEPHRPRANAFGVSLPTLGLGAPSLRSLPQFTPPPSVSRVNADDRPKVLAVPFPGTTSDPTEVPPVVYVGTVRYATDTPSAALRVDPSDPDNKDSVALPLVEPRSYAASESNQLVYEGRVLAGDKLSGFVDEAGTAISDPTALFCNSGVYDVAAMTDYAKTVLGLGDAEAQTFAELHADYVQITGDFPSIIDTYWQSAGAPAGGYQGCLAKFQEPPRTGATELDPARDLIVLEAYQDHVVLAPRQPECVVGSQCFDAAACTALWQNGVYVGEPLSPDATAKPEACAPKDITWTDLEQCFPGGLRYTVRGSNQWVLATNRSEVLHDLIADPANAFRCVRDCDPRKQLFRDRAFEIGRTSTCGGSGKPSADNCAFVSVGPATEADGPCRYDPRPGGTTRGVGLADGAAPCIFENLTARFAVYRGKQPSVRDMVFSWDTTGGFYPLAASLAAVSSAVLPQRVKYLTEYQALGIIDAASLGVSLMSLDTLKIQDPWPVY